MYCMKCGNQLPEDARFCEKCGTPVNKVDEGNQRQSKDISDSDTSATNQKPEHPGRDWKETGAAAFQEISGNVMSAADYLGLDQWQRITSMIAACSVLAFLICITGTLASWFSTISGIMLLIFCLKKKTYDSMELALTMTVFIMRFVTVDIRVLFGEHIYYHVSTMIMRIILYALLVIYWLAVSGKFQRKEAGMAWVLILSGVTVVYSVCDVFLSFQYGFRSVLFSAGRAGFFACYVILISRDQKIMDYIRAAFGLRASGIKQSFGQTNFHSGSAEAETKIQPEAVIQPEPSAQTESQEEAVDIKSGRPLFCLSCGNRLSADSAFCEHCGAAIDMAAQEK